MSIPKPEKMKILVIDDHELVLDGTINALQKQYPLAKIFMAQTAHMARLLVEKYHFSLILMELSLPENSGLTAQVDTGSQLLKTFMQYPTINIVVQSTYTRSLIRIRHEIDTHKGGFTVADKSLCTQENLNRIEWALQGLTHTKDIKAMQGLEVKPEWLTVLDLAFGQGLQDKAIAQIMNRSERMVRHYWTKVQDVLGVYPQIR